MSSLVVLCYEIRCPRYIVGYYFYSLENRLIDVVGFRLCYNPYKHPPDQDSNLGRIQPHGPLQLLGPSPGEYLWYRN
jgi:hypothetical protein